MTEPMTDEPPRGYRMLAAELHQQIYEGDSIAEAAVREIRRLREENERLRELAEHESRMMHNSLVECARSFPEEQDDA